MLEISKAIFQDFLCTPKIIIHIPSSIRFYKKFESKTKEQLLMFLYKRYFNMEEKRKSDGRDKTSAFDSTFLHPEYSLKCRNLMEGEFYVGGKGKILSASHTIVTVQFGSIKLQIPTEKILQNNYSKRGFQKNDTVPIPLPCSQVNTNPGWYSYVSPLGPPQSGNLLRFYININYHYRIEVLRKLIDCLRMSGIRFLLKTYHDPICSRVDSSVFYFDKTISVKHMSDLVAILEAHSEQINAGCPLFTLPLCRGGGLAEQESETLASDSYGLMTSRWHRDALFDAPASLPLESLKNQICTAKRNFQHIYKLNATEFPKIFFWSEGRNN